MNKIKWNIVFFWSMILILAFLICNQKTIIREGFREGVSGVCQAYNKASHKLAVAEDGSNESTGRPTHVPPNTTWDEVEKVCKKQGKAGDSSPRAGCIKFKPWKKTRAERKKYGTPCCWKEDTGKWYYNTTTSTPKHFCKRAATKTATKSTKKGKCRVFSKASYAAAAKEAKSGGTTLPTFDKSDQMCGAYGEVDCTNPGPRLWSEYDNSLDKDMRYPCCWHYDGTRGGKVKRSNKGDKTKCQGQTATKKVETKTSKQPVAKKVVKDATVGLCKAKDKTASWEPDSATIAGCQKAKTQKDCIAEDAAASKAKRAKSTSKGGAISYETMCQWTGTSSTSTPKKGVAAEKSVITSAPVKSGDTLGAGSKGLDVDYVKGSKWKIQVGKKTGALEFRYDGKPVAEISGDGEVKGTQCTCGSWNLRDSRMGIVGRNDINLHTDGWARMLKYGSPEVSKGKHTTADYTKGGWAGKKLYYLKGGKTGTALA